VITLHECSVRSARCHTRQSNRRVKDPFARWKQGSERLRIFGSLRGKVENPIRVVLGAILAAGLVVFCYAQTGLSVNWRVTLLLLPALYLAYRSYELYLGKLATERRHAEEMVNLHLRTVEVLALAIEAKDQTTHQHLQRVRIYATEIGRELGITPDEAEALQAAALLHDIGKLAIPEHIVSKPGRLTPEEFEKMKTHPLVGAEILEKVGFPYPVVPIVRAHHEKWDGSGYPFGLKRTNIPIGARILSAADFFDALVSDRQYRRALPPEEALKSLLAESGKSFDPAVVNVLYNRHKHLEEMVGKHSLADAPANLSTAVKIERGNAPGAGLEQSAPESGGVNHAHFLDAIAGARHEAQLLFELSQELGASLSLDETLSVFATKVKRLLPHDSLIIFVRRDKRLIAAHTSGESCSRFADLQIGWGEGLSGWVAQNNKPMINGNPGVEPGHESDPLCFNSFKSALAVPLEGLDGVVGVVSLYRTQAAAFTSEHLRILLAISSKMGVAIENALKFKQAEESATTDYLTQLPNVRSLSSHLERELARAERSKSALTVMVCDLDGFKQVNDRFGHLVGNRVLQRFAARLKETCREYDYVARMGGDEFVVVVPDLPMEAAQTKALQLAALALEVGKEVCGETLLSLSVGYAAFPADAADAEQLLAEADRRMYAVKANRPHSRNRRTYPRLRCQIAVEMEAEGQPFMGNVTDISMSGCYVETSHSVQGGAMLSLSFATPNGALRAEGEAVRVRPGWGFGIRFHDIRSADRERLRRILDYVENGRGQHEVQRYLAALKGQ
jgi:diguanylate cyclase (GGDEF)-like protein/putative nucleotidyltransferase with HDIG domain